MRTDATMNFDAVSLRDECAALCRAVIEPGHVDFGDVVPGEHPTQRGAFDICSRSAMISVCVWDHGTVEIVSLAISGETKEIETLENSGLADAAQSVRKHIAKYA